MFKNAKIGDRVWDFSKGWGTILNTTLIENYPIMVKFDDSKRTDKTYTFEGKAHNLDINPSLFWNEIKFETPEKLFNLENELRKLEIKEFENGEINYYLYWSNAFEKIKIDCTMVVEIPFAKYFVENEALTEFEKNLKNPKITKEDFFTAYKNVFGDKK